MDRCEGFVQGEVRHLECMVRRGSTPGHLLRFRQCGCICIGNLYGKEVDVDTRPLWMADDEGGLLEHVAVKKEFQACHGSKGFLVQSAGIEGGVDNQLEVPFVPLAPRVQANHHSRDVERFEGDVGVLMLNHVLVQHFSQHAHGLLGIRKKFLLEGDEVVDPVLQHPFEVSWT